MAVGVLPFIGGYAVICPECPAPASISPALVGNLNEFAGETGLAIIFYNGILTVLVAWVGYRKWSTLAWYVLMVTFLFYVVDIGFFGLGLPGLVSVLLLAVALFVPFRRFFPKARVTPS